MSSNCWKVLATIAIISAPCGMAYAQVPKIPRGFEDCVAIIEAPDAQLRECIVALAKETLRAKLLSDGSSKALDSIGEDINRLEERVREAELRADAAERKVQRLLKHLNVREGQLPRY